MQIVTILSIKKMKFLVLKWFFIWSIYYHSATTNTNKHCKMATSIEHRKQLALLSLAIDCSKEENEYAEPSESIADRLIKSHLSDLKSHISDLRSQLVFALPKRAKLNEPSLNQWALKKSESNRETLIQLRTKAGSLAAEQAFIDETMRNGGLDDTLYERSNAIRVEMMLNAQAVRNLEITIEGFDNRIKSESTSQNQMIDELDRQIFDLNAQLTELDPHHKISDLDAQLAELDTHHTISDLKTQLAKLVCHHEIVDTNALIAGWTPYRNAPLAEFTHQV